MMRKTGTHCWFLSDQLQPFRDALVHVSDQTWEDAVSEDKKFNGTLFRFSLRNEPY
uniref:Uncharacterized protein n=1 Tax=Anguilla anguilla TaxID=7936 RepID=A0A0E9PQP9_ANGAN